MQGSVFTSTCVPAAFLGFAALGIKTAIRYSPWLEEASTSSAMANNSVFMSSGALIGFFVIFRTQLSYSRFWEGCTSIKLMQSEYFATGSGLVAFCRGSKADPGLVRGFQVEALCLLSMLHAVCLRMLQHNEACNSQEVLDVEQWGADIWRAIETENSKVELIMQWVQALIVDAQQSNIITVPAPVLSRVFQNLSNGLTAYYSASRISEVPYPFPFAQTTEVLLWVFAILSPFAACAYTQHEIGAFILCFLSNLMLFSLNQIAVELEDPYGTDPNDLDLDMLQMEINDKLLMLLSHKAENSPKIHAFSNPCWSCMGKTSNVPYKSSFFGRMTKVGQTNSDTSDGAEAAQPPARVSVVTVDTTRNTTKAKLTRRTTLSEKIQDAYREAPMQDKMVQSLQDYKVGNASANFALTDSFNAENFHANDADEGIVSLPEDAIRCVPNVHVTHGSPPHSPKKRGQIGAHGSDSEIVREYTPVASACAKRGANVNKNGGNTQALMPERVAHDLPPRLAKTAPTPGPCI